jgi:hypothetical protein
MTPLSQQFNAQTLNPAAHWSLYIAPLFMLLILDDIARLETRRRKRIARLDRRFNAKATRQSQERYRQETNTQRSHRRLFAS